MRALKNPLFTDAQFGRMSEEVVKLLTEVGYHVGHEGVVERAVRAGCRLSPRGRVLFRKEQIRAIVERIGSPNAPLYYPAGTAGVVHPPRAIRTGLGNLTPKFYDYGTGRAEGGKTAHLLDVVKFAHVEPRVSSVTIPISRQDVPPAIEQIDGVLRMAETTDKAIGETDATVPDAVPFLAEMGTALGADPAGFIGRCNCINPPLRLERRTAETMLARSRWHSMSMVTPMPGIGASGPVDIYGCAVLGTAEIVGGLILSEAIDPEAPLMGYIAVTQMDMRTGVSVSSTAQTVRADAAVYQLMEKRFGGGTRVGGRGYISARRPGLQAAFERFLKAAAYSALVDDGALYPAGTGNLDNGSVFCPEQFLLDLETAGAMEAAWSAPVVPPGGDAAARIAAVILGGGDFLGSDHTLAHWRDELWEPAFLRNLPDTPSEKEVLDRCHETYRAAVASYRPASRPPEVLRELRRIRQAAAESLA